MIDLSKAAEPKSDQLNADDLIGGPMTLKITGVKVMAGEQPVHIEYEGGKGKPWKPCKSMVRALLSAWGKNGEDYVGRSLVVYRDEKVKWAGAEQGGIRISHMSHIQGRLRMMLTISRGKRAPFVVEPLQIVAGKPMPPEALDAWTIKISDAATMSDLSAVGAEIKAQGYDDAGRASVGAVYQSAVERIRASESE